MQQEFINYEIGSLFAGRYVLEKQLGKGGMGRVFLATDKMLGNEKVAVKILHANLTEDPVHRERFLREVTLTRKVAHPNVVRSFDVGIENGALYLTMEYVEGETLKERIQRGPVKPLEAAKMLVEVCKGLAAVHQAEIIHRDLKPANIILCNDGAIKIADFGVARPEVSELTHQDEIVGSTHYMPPEIWRGQNVGPLADIYSLGIVGYEMITGTVPFDGPSLPAVMQKHLQAIPGPPSELTYDLPVWLNNLVLKMLAKDKASRPQSATEIIDIIERNLLDRRGLGSSLVTKIVDSELLSQIESKTCLAITSSSKKRISEKQRENEITPPKTISGSYKIKDIGIQRLDQLYSKRDQELAKWSKRISAWIVTRLFKLVCICLFAGAYYLFANSKLTAFVQSFSEVGRLGTPLSLVALVVICASVSGLIGLVFALGGPIRSSTQAWVKITGYSVASGLIFWAVNIYMLTHSTEGLIFVKNAEYLKFSHSIAMQSSLSVSLLFPNVDISSILNKVTAGWGQHLLTPRLLLNSTYALLVVAYVYLLAKFIKMQAFGKVLGSRTFLVSKFITPIVVLLVIENSLQQRICDLFAAFQGFTVLIVGPYSFQVATYGLACAVINWLYVLSWPFVVIPARQRALNKAKQV